MRMGADAAPDIGMGHSDGVNRVKDRNLVTDRHHQGHTRAARAVNNLGLIFGKLRRVKVHVTVDYHRLYLIFYSAVGSCSRSISEI